MIKSKKKKQTQKQKVSQKVEQKVNIRIGELPAPKKKSRKRTKSQGQVRVPEKKQEQLNFLQLASLLRQPQQPIYPYYQQPFQQPIQQVQQPIQQVQQPIKQSDARKSGLFVPANTYSSEASTPRSLSESDISRELNEERLPFALPVGSQPRVAPSFYGTSTRAPFILRPFERDYGTNIRENLLREQATGVGVGERRAFDPLGGIRSFAPQASEIPLETNIPRFGIGSSIGSSFTIPQRPLEQAFSPILPLRPIPFTLTPSIRGESRLSEFAPSETESLRSSITSEQGGTVFINPTPIREISPLSGFGELPFFTSPQEEELTSISQVPTRAPTTEPIQANLLSLMAGQRPESVAFSEFVPEVSEEPFNEALIQRTDPNIREENINFEIDRISQVSSNRKDTSNIQQSVLSGKTGYEDSPPEFGIGVGEQQIFENKKDIDNANFNAQYEPSEIGTEYSKYGSAYSKVPQSESSRVLEKDFNTGKREERDVLDEVYLELTKEREEEERNRKAETVPNKLDEELEQRRQSALRLADEMIKQSEENQKREEQVKKEFIEREQKKGNKIEEEEDIPLIRKGEKGEKKKLSLSEEEGEESEDVFGFKKEKEPLPLSEIDKLKQDVSRLTQKEIEGLFGTKKGRNKQQQVDNVFKDYEPNEIKQILKGPVENPQEKEKKKTSNF